MLAFIKSKLRSGVVKKKSGDKTICVVHSYSFKHKKYKKIFNIYRKYLVHDENNECNVGEKVLFYYTRPLSCRKSHILYKKI